MNLQGAENLSHKQPLYSCNKEKIVMVRYVYFANFAVWEEYFV